MKKLIILFIALFLISCSSTGYKPVKRNSDITAKVDRKAKTTVYHHKKLNDSPLQFRIIKGNEKHLVMDIVYLANGWLFFDTVLIVGNGEKIALSEISEDDKQTEVHNQVISEIYSTECGDIEQIENLVSGDDLRIKIKGKEDKMFNIPPQQRKAMLEMVTFYKTIK
ncbi:MAG: hypothetical protein JXQ65_06055 [Candidatus Marinimicrobia bacterium]|nr:hypothetical protein [Candidatus Neomarinimicrobiota bacterium]